MHDGLISVESDASGASAQDNVALFAVAVEGRPYRIRVLGRFEIRKTGEPFERMLQSKVLELLQALLALGGRDVSASVLIDAIWPDFEADAAYHAFESTLHRLRKLVGPGLVQLVGGKLTLDEGQCWVDMWEFNKLTKAAGGSESARLERFNRVRELYAGHLLEQETDKSWALRPRQVLRNRFVRAVREAALIHESRGRWREAASVYESALDLEIVAEDLTRHLMTCLSHLEEYSEALQAYHHLRDLLKATVGIAPNLKTEAVHMDVRRRAAACASRARLLSVSAA